MSLAALERGWLQFWASEEGGFETRPSNCRSRRRHDVTDFLCYFGPSGVRRRQSQQPRPPLWPAQAPKDPPVPTPATTPPPSPVTTSAPTSHPVSAGASRGAPPAASSSLALPVVSPIPVAAQTRTAFSNPVPGDPLWWLLLTILPTLFAAWLIAFRRVILPASRRPRAETPQRAAAPAQA